MRNKIKIVFINFSIIFTLFTFGCIEIYFGNQADFIFDFKNLLPSLIIVTVAYTIVGSLITCVLNKNGRGIFLSVTISIALFAYLQREFLNTELNEMNGNEVIWGRTLKILNLLIFLVIISFFLLLKKYKRKMWGNVIIALAILLTVMQFTAMFYLLVTTKTTNKILLSTEEEFEISSQNNIFVFILDRFDRNWYEAVKEDDVFHEFTGFTYYDDTTSPYNTTWRSLPYLLTGVENHNQVLREEGIERAWKQSPFLDELKKNNYDIQFFTESDCIGSNAEQWIDNIDDSDKDISSFAVLKAMSKCLGYSEMPYAFKKYFWYYTDDINKIVQSTKQESRYYEINDLAFYTQLQNVQLNTQDKKNCFRFYHLLGSHKPLTLTSDLKSLPDGQESTYEEQTKAALKIVAEFLSQLKERNLYNNSTIVIMGDHGATDEAEDRDEDGLATLRRVCKPTMFIKLPGESDEKMVYSEKQVTINDSIATILEAEGLDTSGVQSYSTPISEIQEDETRERYFYFGRHRKGKEIDLQRYNITGNGNDFANWKWDGKSWPKVEKNE